MMVWFMSPGGCFGDTCKTLVLIYRIHFKMTMVAFQINPSFCRLMVSFNMSISFTSLVNRVDNHGSRYVVFPPLLLSMTSHNGIDRITLHKSNRCLCFLHFLAYDVNLPRPPYLEVKVIPRRLESPNLLQQH